MLGRAYPPSPASLTPLPASLVLGQSVRQANTPSPQSTWVGQAVIAQFAPAAQCTKQSDPPEHLKLQSPSQVKSHDPLPWQEPLESGPTVATQPSPLAQVTSQLLPQSNWHWVWPTQSQLVVPPSTGVSQAHMPASSHTVGFIGGGPAASFIGPGPPSALPMLPASIEVLPALAAPALAVPPLAVPLLLALASPVVPADPPAAGAGVTSESSPQATTWMPPHNRVRAVMVRARCREFVIGSSKSDHDCTVRRQTPAFSPLFVVSVADRMDSPKGLPDSIHPRARGENRSPVVPLKYPVSG